MMLQRIYVACTVEARIERFCPCIFWCLKRAFFKHDKKRVYIVTHKMTDDIITND